MSHHLPALALLLALLYMLAGAAYTVWLGLRHVIALVDANDWAALGALAWYLSAALVFRWGSQRHV